MSVIRCSALILLCMLQSCASIHESEDFERHRMTRFTVPYDRPDVFYFDVMLTGMPADDQNAEQRRLGWLQAWLDSRQICGSGYDVLERRPFHFEESNPGRYDLRYVVSCKPAPEPELEPE